MLGLCFFHRFYYPLHFPVAFLQVNVCWSQFFQSPSSRTPVLSHSLSSPALSGCWERGCLKQTRHFTRMGVFPVSFPALWRTLVRERVARAAAPPAPRACGGTEAADRRASERDGPAAGRAGGFHLVSGEPNPFCPLSLCRGGAGAALPSARSSVTFGVNAAPVHPAPVTLKHFCSVIYLNANELYISGT